MKKNKDVTFKDATKEAKKYILKSGLSVVGVTLLFFTLNSVLLSLGIYKTLIGFLTLCPCVLADFYIIKKYTKSYKQKLNIICNKIVEYYKQDAENMKEEIIKKQENVLSEEKIKNQNIIDDNEETFKYSDINITKTENTSFDREQLLNEPQKDKFVDKDKTINSSNVKTKSMDRR